MTTLIRDDNATAVQGVGNYALITLAAPTTTLVKTGSGFLFSITVNTSVSGGVIEYDDALTHTNAMGTIVSGGSTPYTVPINMAFTTGLTIYTSTQAQNITVNYR